MKNGYVDSFSGKFRDEWLNQCWFRDVEDARHLMEEYRTDYNWQRTHSTLGNLTPEEFVRRVAGADPHGGRAGGESPKGIHLAEGEKCRLDSRWKCSSKWGRVTAACSTIHLRKARGSSSCRASDRLMNEDKWRPDRPKSFQTNDTAFVTLLQVEQGLIL
jgi:hypothetical protein